jgi:GH3 auxin-responsive promoter
MTNLLPLLVTAARATKANFVRKTRQALATQEQFLRSVLVRHQNTEYGQKYGLSDIKTIEQFQAQVPILPYSSYEPYIERIANGEKNVLTADPVVYFSLTSGSTGTKKMIPVTYRFQNSLRRSNLTSIGFLSDALQARDSQFGKTLITNTGQLLGRTHSGIEYGPAAAGVFRMNKLLYSQIFAHPSQTPMIADSLARHYLCLLFALRDHSTRSLAANYPMLILRICAYLEQYAEDFIHDLETGTIASWLTLEPDLRAKLEKQWFPNPSRAAELKAVLRSHGRLTPQYAWRNLSAIVTARGGTSDFYFERFPDYFGDIPGFGAAYSSAEGSIGVYPDLDMDGSIPAIESGFFEFVPQDQWEVEHPKTLLATEVKTGFYRILMTNYSGFYRYDIGDVVEVVGSYEQAPLIVFRYRAGGLLSSTFEKTTEFHATQVMQGLQREFDVFLEDFCITLSEHEFPSHYLVNIELSPGSAIDNPQAFLSSFERRLRAANTFYAVNRRNQIPSPRLRILAPGSFAILRQRQLQKGIPDPQLKFPHLSEDRRFLAGLTVMQESQLQEMD